MSRLDRLRNDIVIVGERAVQNAEEENITANTTVTEINNQIGRLTEERNGIQSDIKKREGTIADLSEQETQIGERIAQRNSERTALAIQVTEQNQDLRALQNDINMFPTVFSGFVSQAAQTTGLYWKLAAVPIGLMVIMTCILIFNAATLTTVIDENDNARIFSILTTRLPYVIIATAVLGAAYKLAAFLVSEIMRINQQRLNLSKVSIIATDISDASAVELTELSEEELWQLKTRLKMDMLRDHMKDYLSREFQPIVRNSSAKIEETDDDGLVEDRNGIDYDP